jgi:hypothetical protein
MRSSDERQGTTVRSNSDDRGKVLKFRPPEPSTESERREAGISEVNIVRLLDLSKYERPRETPDEFKVQMRQNIVALMVLGVLIGIAATDFSDIEQVQRCAIIWDCNHH